MIRREDVAEFVVNGIVVSADLEEFSMYTDYLVDIMHLGEASRCPMVT